MGKNQKWTQIFTLDFISMYCFLITQSRSSNSIAALGGCRKEGKGSWQEHHAHTRFQQLTLQFHRSNIYKHPLNLNTVKTEISYNLQLKTI